MKRKLYETKSNYNYMDIDKYSCKHTNAYIHISTEILTQFSMYFFDFSMKKSTIFLVPRGEEGKKLPIDGIESCLHFGNTKKKTKSKTIEHLHNVHKVKYLIIEIV